MYNKLKDILKKRKIKHKDLAEWLEIKPGTLGCYFNGDPKFPITTLKRVARFLDVPVEDIMESDEQLDAIPENEAYIECPYCHRKHVVKLTTRK